MEKAATCRLFYIFYKIIFTGCTYHWFVFLRELVTAESYFDVTWVRKDSSLKLRMTTRKGMNDISVTGDILRNA